MREYNEDSFDIWCYGHSASHTQLNDRLWTVANMWIKFIIPCFKQYLTK